MAVTRTRLHGVKDHVVIHANHAELIRAPLLFPDPGPVACMPVLAQVAPSGSCTRQGWTREVMGQLLVDAESRITAL